MTYGDLYLHDRPRLTGELKDIETLEESSSVTTLYEYIYKRGENQQILRFKITVTLDGFVLKNKDGAELSESSSVIDLWSVVILHENELSVKKRKKVN